MSSGWRFLAISLTLSMRKELNFPCLVCLARNQPFPANFQIVSKGRVHARNNFPRQPVFSKKRPRSLTLTLDFFKDLYGWAFLAINLTFPIINSPCAKAFSPPRLSLARKLPPTPQTVRNGKNTFPCSDCLRRETHLPRPPYWEVTEEKREQVLGRKPVKSQRVVHWFSFGSSFFSQQLAFFHFWKRNNECVNSLLCLGNFFPETNPTRICMMWTLGLRCVLA